MRVKSAGHGGVAILAGLALASGANATIFSDGTTLSGGGSGTNWSSDLGPDNFSGLFSDSENRGPGGTTPIRPHGTLYSGENVTNFAGPLVNFGGTIGTLTSSVSLDVAPGGEVTGQLNHVVMDATVPTVGGYGMFTYTSINPTEFFYGGIDGTPTFVYWAMQWAMSTDLTPHAGLNAAYLLDIGGNTSGGRFEAGGFAPTNFVGAAHGVFQLRGGDTAGSFQNGTGPETQQFMFELSNGAGSSAPGGSARLEAWYEFSETPIDHVTFPTAGIPEPASWALLIMGFGGVGVLARRRGLRTA